MRDLIERAHLPDVESTTKLLDSHISLATLPQLIYPLVGLIRLRCHLELRLEFLNLSRCVLEIESGS